MKINSTLRNTQPRYLITMQDQGSEFRPAGVNTMQDQGSDPLELTPCKIKVQTRWS
jgi:hypothetical protein